MNYPLASACILHNCMNVTLSSSFKLIILLGLLIHYNSESILNYHSSIAIVSLNPTTCSCITL